MSVVVNIRKKIKHSDGYRYAYVVSMFSVSKIKNTLTEQLAYVVSISAVSKIKIPTRIIQHMLFQCLT
jgi:hypothetical protein